jgi:hypothetical protein
MGSSRSRLPPQKKRTRVSHQSACPVSGSGAAAGGASATADGTPPPPPPPPPEDGLLVGAGTGVDVGGTLVGGMEVGGAGVGVNPAWTDWIGIVRLPARMHSVAISRAIARSQFTFMVNILVIVASRLPAARALPGVWH